MDCGNKASLDFSGSQSIAMTAWIKWNASTEAYNCIIAREDSSKGYTLLLKSNQKLAVYFSGAATFNMDGLGGIIPFGSWHHIVAVYNGSNITTYIDGVQDYSKPVTGTYGSVPNALWIGKSIFGSGRWYSGQIDEVKIFNRALTAAEILSMYNHEKGKLSVGKDGTMKALEFVEDPTLPVQMRSKKQSLTVKGQLIEQ